MPICASGNNSAILHYVANDQELKNGEFLLIDAGAEYHGYGTDITSMYTILFYKEKLLKTLSLFRNLSS